MQIPQEWFWPYVCSNLVAVTLVFVAWGRPRIAKLLFALMFLGASYANASLALRRPEDYLNYDKFVLLDAYHDFITGFFAEHLRAIVLTIASGQFLIGVLLCFKGNAAKLGVVGAAIFLAAIIPLGVGSAFPFSIFCLMALLLVYLHEARPAARRANNGEPLIKGSV